MFLANELDIKLWNGIHVEYECGITLPSYTEKACDKIKNNVFDIIINPMMSEYKKGDTIQVFFGEDKLSFTREDIEKNGMASMPYPEIAMMMKLANDLATEMQLHLENESKTEIKYTYNQVETTCAFTEAVSEVYFTKLSSDKSARGKFFMLA